VAQHVIPDSDSDEEYFVLPAPLLHAEPIWDEEDGNYYYPESQN